MLTVFGSTALDTIRTPSKVLKGVFGGAATFAGISASYFSETGLIAVVGRDFPKKYYNILAKKLDLRGLKIEDGKTFRYDGSYDETLSTRTTLKTELNVLGNFKPSVPEEYRKSEYVYLANNDPEQNADLIKEFDNVKFSMCDTIEFWIAHKKPSVIKMMKTVDAVVINDEEAQLLTKEQGKPLSGMGSEFEVGGAIAWAEYTAAQEVPTDYPWWMFLFGWLGGLGWFVWRWSRRSGFRGSFR